MSREEFEELVRQAVESLPREFLDRLDNVEIVVEEWPRASQLMSLGLHPSSLLFGLYQGLPKTRPNRSIYPDKITIFAGPILQVSPTPEMVKQKVTQVVKHEIAHHFGMDENRVRKTGH